MVSMDPGSAMSFNNKYAREAKASRDLALGHLSVVSAPFDCVDNCRKSEHPESLCCECAQNLGNPSGHAPSEPKRGSVGPWRHTAITCHMQTDSLLGETSKVSGTAGRLITTALLTDLGKDLRYCHNHVQNALCQAAAMRTRWPDWKKFRVAR
jgi:hypothetical protein